MIKIINIAFSNPVLKITSLLLSFGIWLIFSNNQIIQIEKNAQIFFYNNNANFIIDGPTSIDITIYGKKSAFWNLNKEELAIFINADEIKNGIPYTLTDSNLFLPSTIKLVDYKPKKIIFKKLSNI